MGTLVIVSPGQRVAVDGVVTAGASAVDESMLTGEPAPVVKGPGAPVFGGTINCGGSPLTVRSYALRDLATARRGCLLRFDCSLLVRPFHSLLQCIVVR